ncbi:MAG: YbaB/EbfC family nucleoid-associated protein [Phycisphaeraceae bacterium]
MFEQMKMMKELGSLMARKDELKERVERLKIELGEKSVEAEAAGGIVRVTVNGHLKVLEVRFSPTALATTSDSDRAMLEDLTRQAINDAMAKAQAMIKNEIQKATADLNIPGVENMLPMLN